ncbi:MAG: hypothetical protein KAX04_03420 [Methanomicrobia archaeon]|nr:hypothetical protein [Methanomicrobia archaeon]
MNTDILHTPSTHREWNESFYFNCYDKKNDICAFMRIGLKPNKNEKSMFCFFMMPDGSLRGTKDQESYENNELRVKNLQFDLLVPEKKWHLTFSGMMKTPIKEHKSEFVSFSLDFESINKIFDYRECVSKTKEKISQRVVSEHLEQFGRVNGTLTIGKKEYHLNGLGERDHSWGVRDWNAPKMWIWLTCQVSESCAFNVTKLVMDEGEVDAGFIHINGKNIPLARVVIDTEYEKDTSPKSFTVALKDKNGDLYNIEAQILKKALLPFTGENGTLSVMHETLAEYVFDGKIGYGIAEYLVRNV